MPSLLSLALSHTLTRLKVLLFIPVCVVCQVVLLARLLTQSWGNGFDYASFFQIILGYVDDLA